MGVDWADCDSCGRSICDAGDSWNSCPICGRLICNKCLAAPKDYDEDGELLKECCPFCSGKEVHNDDLLEFLLDYFKLTKEEAIEKYKEEF